MLRMLRISITYNICYWTSGTDVSDTYCDEAAEYGNTSDDGDMLQ